MWVNDLADVYEGLITEDYQGLRSDFPRVPPGYKGPVDAGGRLSYRNNKVGLQAPNLAALSQAGDVPFGNPTEQEETFEGNVSKNDLFQELKKLGSSLDSSSPTDRVALLILSQIKKKFK